ncbi:MAG: enoyl-CoA hydratase-related protein [Desulfobacterales bacterium]|jgi:enoyl-CoA hydratase/carnithine racemase|nr:enoyl-CoA hydratase-related protein [Desulfobacterales bacterium]MDP6683563.1 enoyl-CoA hydratase-related protein [Desulfobacterales bacterium]MDP6807389.1 enoyl-CoA hydratase-related protein [Desulfobacterales bacterium]|tara:strand:+ start:10715 stop:11497 length:783 start_codon:yes stop_codon:yes gene_type:complete
MKDNILLTEEKEQVALLTLNRPEVMNALNFSLLYALKDQIEALRIRSDIRVIIITGAGDKAFCAGADLKERATLNPAQVKEFILTIKNLFSSIEYLNKPVIAAINGIALGGGTELALASDIRIAASNASLGLTETRLAIIPGAGGTQRLPRLVGRGKAKELIFTGRRVMAEEALQINLVNHTCESALLIEECQKMAAMICETGPIAIEQAKYAINYGLETDLQTGLAIESNAYWVTISTEDRLEALAAFGEKRKPVFKGK